MSAAAGQLRVCQTSTVLTFQVIGRATMALSMPLRRVSEQALARGIACLHIDLRHCQYIDSTFVGTLLGLRRTAGARANFVLVCPSASCQHVFDTMGLGAFFSVLHCEELPDHVWEELDITTDDRVCLKFNVCESHQELVNVGGRTAAPFRAVAETMQRELDAERCSGQKSPGHDL